MDWAIAGTDIMNGAGIDSIHEASLGLNVLSAAGLIPYDDYEVDWADNGEPFGMDQCCGGAQPAPSPAPAPTADAPLESADPESDSDNGATEAPNMRNPAAWMIGWYDCNHRSGRLSFLTKVKNWVDKAAIAMGAASAKIPSGGYQDGAIAAAGAMGINGIDLGQAIDQIDSLPCFPAPY